MNIGCVLTNNAADNVWIISRAEKGRNNIDDIVSPHITT